MVQRPGRGHWLRASSGPRREGGWPDAGQAPETREPWLAAPRGAWLTLPLVLRREALSGLGWVPAAGQPRAGAERTAQGQWAPGGPRSPQTPGRAGHPQGQAGLLWHLREPPPHMVDEFRVADTSEGEAPPKAQPRPPRGSRVGPTPLCGFNTFPFL